ncbi:MAG TPA: PAS domain S-box protein, partial [Thermoanaerobaculia bacterium]|nr:PAS domain S-box protein [Thermoanaerobaculia bacterium]
MRSTIESRAPRADLLAALLDAAPIGLYVIEDDRFAHVNRVFAETLGYTKEEILALDAATDIIVDQQQEHVQQIVRERRAGDDEPKHYAVQVRGRDGSIIETEVHSTVAYAGDKRVICGAAIDVTARSNVMRRIAEREEYFRAMTENMSDIIAILDPEGRATYVSPSVERLLGYKPDELVGRPHFESVHPDDRDRIVAAVRRLASASGPRVSETYRFQRKDGRWRVLESVGTNLLDHPQVRGLVLNTRDVTDRRQMEQELEQLNRLTSIGRLAAQVAHEFNNVLMGIQPAVEIIRRFAAGDPQRARLADLIASSIARGKRITTEVLRFGRPAQPTLRPVDAAELLRQAAEEIRPMLPPRVTLDLQPADVPMHAMADRAQLAQVLVNLALNARDAMEAKGGTLTIAVRPAPENFVEFSVSDTGCGIAREDLPFIFEPLFSTKRTGTGLGLSVVFQIVSAHRGHISVESEVGQGSTFQVRIPAVVEESPREDVPHEPAPAAVPLPRQRRVLMVEDDEAIAAGMQWSLEAEGIDVQVITTAGGVLPAIERFRPDVVLLDLSLPDDDGRNVYTRIAQRYDVPVIFSTGHAPEHEIEALLASPRTAFLMKPYSLQELLQAV